MLNFPLYEHIFFIKNYRYVLLNEIRTKEDSIEHNHFIFGQLFIASILTVQNKIC